MRFLGVLLVFIGFAVSAQQKQASTDEILFSIRQPAVVYDGVGKAKIKQVKVPVTKAEFIYLYKKNHTRKEDFSDVKENEYLNLLINFKLKIAEARHRGFDTTAAFKKEFAGYKEELKKPYLAGSDDMDRLTKEAYDHLKEEVKASHILITVKPDAAPADTLAAYQKIEALRKRAVGGEDFEKMAKEFSEDPSAKQNSGNLGYFGGFQMVYPFEKAAFATPVGSISPILRTRFGYHILKVFDRVPARGEVEVSHILLRADGTPGNDVKIKNLIFEIYDQLKAKRPWDDLVKEYSADQNTKNTGGRLKPFAPGVYATVPEFEQVAFAMKNPGDISDPFQSKVGWHIIRLEKKISLQPYAELEAGLKRKVARDERLQISKTNSLLKRKAANGFTEKTEVKNKVLASTDSSVNKGKWQYPSLGDEVLFVVQGKPYMVNEFIAYVNAHPAPSPQIPSKFLTNLYGRFSEEKLSEAEESGIRRDHPEYSLLLKEYEEGILLFEIMEKQIWNKASEDSIGQRKFYETHKAKYTAGDRVEAAILSTQDKMFFDQMHVKVAKGDSITAADVKKFKSVQNKRAWEHGDSKVIDKVKWIPGIQEAEADGTFYLVQITKLIAPGTKTFEEARASVISDYQDELEKQWLATLRQKYSVQVNKKAKNAVIAELNK